MLGLISTWMGNQMWADKQSWYETTTQLYQYSSLASHSEYTSTVAVIFQCKLSAAEYRWWHPVGTCGSRKEFTCLHLFCGKCKFDQ